MTTNQQKSKMDRRSFVAGAGAAGLTFVASRAVRGFSANSKIRLGLIGCGGRGNWITDLFLNNGTDAPFNGKPGTENIVIPTAYFVGRLTIPVTVPDGLANSAPFHLVMTVTPENDRPVIRGQKTRVTGVDEPATVDINDLELTDLDNMFPDDFTLTVYAGENYAVSVIPDAGFAGLLTVPVTTVSTKAKSSFSKSRWMTI